MEIATLASSSPWAVISICEKGLFPDIATNDQMIGRLNLQFDDVDFYKNGEREDGRILFDENHAERILAFYQNLRNYKSVIVYIHCLKGQCRSPAIAAALELVEGQDNRRWFSTKKPNMRVYSTIVALFHKYQLI